MKKRAEMFWCLLWDFCFALVGFFVCVFLFVYLFGFYHSVSLYPCVVRAAVLSSLLCELQWNSGSLMAYFVNAAKLLTL